MVGYLRFLGDEEGVLQLDDIADGNGHLVPRRSPVNVSDPGFGEILTWLPKYSVEHLTGIGHESSYF